MPPFTIKHHTVLSREVRFGGKLLINLSHNARLFCLAFEVELVQLFRYVFAARLVFAGKELNHVASNVHASGGIYARPQPEPDIASGKSTSAGQPRDLH